MKLLREFTMARVGLGRAGSSMATRDVLEFQLAHAQARDAVHLPLDTQILGADCEARGWPVVLQKSAAGNRGVYLRRPDLGRKVDAPLGVLSGALQLAIVVVDGLSAEAVHSHAVPLLVEVFKGLKDWRCSPICIVEQGRVAIGDEIASRFSAEMVLVLIGERPGLSSTDSLGAYLTWNPRAGRTDSERNCISNIRNAGLGYEEAAGRILWLLYEARRLRLTGVALKEFTADNQFGDEPSQLSE